MGRAIVALVLAAVVAGCGVAESGTQQPPRDGRAGLQVTGTAEGRQIAVRDGAPQLVVGDCDPTSPPDDDVCAISQTVGGELFVLSFENPDVLEEGAELAVADSGCGGPSCDDITDFAVVDVQLGGGERIRATEGEIRVRSVEPFLHYAGTLRLELPSGRLSGDFDLVPRED